MLNTEVYIRIRWGNKAQSISEASTDIAMLLLFLSQFDSLYRNMFFATGEGDKDHEFASISSMDVKQISSEICERYLDSNRQELERHNPGITIDSAFRDPVGFLLSFYSSSDPSKCFSIRSTIGKYGKADYPNQILLTFPPKYLNDGKWFRKIFEYLIENFEPEKGGIYPEFTTRLKGNPKEYPGWVSYYSKRINLPTIPSTVEKQDFKKGVILFVTRDDFDVQNQEHVQKWKEFYLSF